MPEEKQHMDRRVEGTWSVIPSAAWWFETHVHFHSQKRRFFAGWWFGTFFIFPYIGLLIIPTDFHIFQRGGPGPPTSLTLKWLVFWHHNTWMPQLRHPSFQIDASELKMPMTVDQLEKFPGAMVMDGNGLMTPSCHQSIIQVWKKDGYPWLSSYPSRICEKSVKKRWLDDKYL